MEEKGGEGEIGSVGGGKEKAGGGGGGEGGEGRGGEDHFCNLPQGQTE